MPCHNTSGERMDRKAKKPLMEKRRRARINKCLGDLKSLLLEHLKRDPSQTSKLEKADILEMTVHLLRRMQQDQLMHATMIQPSARDRFLDGWRDCATQVDHYASTVDGMPAPMKDALQRHLSDRYRVLQQSIPSIPASNMQFQLRHPRPPMAPAVFPIMPPGLRNPILYPPNPFAAAATAMAQHWHTNMVTVAQPLELRQIDVKDRISGSEPAERPISNASTGRLAQTPECYADDDDSASCSSSDATNESPPIAAKDNVWRPW